MSEENRDGGNGGDLGIPDFRSFPLGATQGGDAEAQSVTQLAGTPAYTSIPDAQTTGVPSNVRLPPPGGFASGYATRRGPIGPQQLGGGGALTYHEGPRPERNYTPPPLVGPGGPYTEQLIVPPQVTSTQTTSTGGPTMYPSSGGTAGSGGSVGRPGRAYHGHAAPAAPSGPPRYVPPQYTGPHDPIRTHLPPPTPEASRQWASIIDAFNDPIEPTRPVTQSVLPTGRVVPRPTGAVNPHDPRAARLLGDPNMQYREFRMEHPGGGGYQRGGFNAPYGGGGGRFGGVPSSAVSAGAGQGGIGGGAAGFGGPGGIGGGAPRIFASNWGEILSGQNSSRPSAPARRPDPADFGDDGVYSGNIGVGGGPLRNPIRALGGPLTPQYDYATDRMGRTAGRCCGACAARTGRGLTNVLCAPLRLCGTCCCCGDREDRCRSGGRGGPCQRGDCPRGRGGGFPPPNAGGY